MRSWSQIYFFALNTSRGKGRDGLCTYRSFVYVFVLDIGNIKAFDRNDQVKRNFLNVLVSHCCYKKLP